MEPSDINWTSLIGDLASLNELEIKNQRLKVALEKLDPSQPLAALESRIQSLHDIWIPKSAVESIPKEHENGLKTLANSELFGCLCSIAARDDLTTLQQLLVVQLLHEICRSGLAKPAILVKQIQKLENVVFERLEQKISASAGSQDNLVILIWTLLSSARAKISGSHPNTINTITLILDHIYSSGEPQISQVDSLDTTLQRIGLTKPSDLLFYITSNIVTILAQEVAQAVSTNPNPPEWTSNERIFQVTFFWVLNGLPDAYHYFSLTHRSLLLFNVQKCIAVAEESWEADLHEKLAQAAVNAANNKDFSVCSAALQAMAARKVSATEPSSPELLKKLKKQLQTLLENLSIENLSKWHSFGSMARPAQVSFLPPVVAIAMLAHELDLPVDTLIPARLVKHLNPVTLHDAGKGFVAQNRPACAMQAFFSALYILELSKKEKISTPFHYQTPNIEEAIWVSRAECAIALQDLDWAILDILKALEYNPTKLESQEVFKKALTRHQEEIMKREIPPSRPLRIDVADIVDNLINEHDIVLRRSILYRSFAELPALAVRQTPQNAISTACQMIQQLSGTDPDNFKRLSYDFFLSGALRNIFGTWLELCKEVELDTLPGALNCAICTSSLWIRMISVLPHSCTKMISLLMDESTPGELICRVLTSFFRESSLRKSTSGFAIFHMLTQISSTDFLSSKPWITLAVTAAARYMELCFLTGSRMTAFKFAKSSYFEDDDEDLQEKDDGDQALETESLSPFLSTEPLDAKKASKVIWFQKWLNATMRSLSLCKLLSREVIILPVTQSGISNSIVLFLQKYWQICPRELLELAVKSLHLLWSPPRVSGEPHHSWAELCSRSTFGDQSIHRLDFELDALVRLLTFGQPFFNSLADALASKRVNKDDMKDFLLNFINPLASVVMFATQAFGICGDRYSAALFPLVDMVRQFSDPKILKTKSKKEVEFCTIAAASFRLPWKSSWSVLLDDGSAHQYWVVAVPTKTAADSALELAIKTASNVAAEDFKEQMWGAVGEGNHTLSLACISAVIDACSLSPRFNMLRAKFLVKRATLLLDQFPPARHAKEDVETALHLDRHAKVPTDFFSKLAAKTREQSVPSPAPAASSAPSPSPNAPTASETGEPPKKKNKKKKKKKKAGAGAPAAAPSAPSDSNLSEDEEEE
eukprot:TRINITY_DN6585_c1_g2_i1.p1 TRINITY_DN6585_c1_g2~~TRINITY_DN6585_c1_g2_i1.p1  ORF type:complete len:1166 (+),score=227.73 TRINITY_DN6585_c1_g2_i1:115-3612(+)